MQQGWVYVLVNSSMPGMAKVGRTARPPTDRVAELSQVTGVATPFVLAFDQAFADCCAAEKTVHDELDRRGLRVASNREFFRGSPSDIIRLVLETADVSGQPNCAPTTDSEELLVIAGDKCLFGTGDRLQDTAEAIRFYKLAAARGSMTAYERLGRAYMSCCADRSGTAARRRALEYLREGIRKGNFYCYAEMASLFARERNLLNFNKAWELFFAACEQDAVTGSRTVRFETACCRYIASCLALGIDPGHQDRFKGCVHGLTTLLLIELDQVRQNPPARRLVTACLRWVHQSLSPVQPTIVATWKRSLQDWDAPQPYQAVSRPRSWCIRYGDIGTSTVGVGV